MRIAKSDLRFLPKAPAMADLITSKLRGWLHSGFRQMSDSEFIDFCYRKLLGREVDPDARQHLLEILRRRNNRLQVIETIINSKEFGLYHRILHDPFVKFAPPGNFYSPLPAITDVQENYDRVQIEARQYKDNKVIDLNPEGQLALLDELRTFFGELPFDDAPRPPLRYGYLNDQFGHGDAAILYGMLRYFRPRRVIEVGSGHSSAVMLDTNDLFLDRRMELTFIEPFPTRLYRLLGPTDRDYCSFIAKPVQDADRALFSTLGKNDILFIDSSHVVKFGSDLCYLLFYILPFLNPGVLIHFHDIFWPFEYSLPWLMEGRAWNEIYFLKAFLAFNHHYQIIFFNHFLYNYHRDPLLAALPIMARNPGCSIWLKKTT